MNSSNTTFQSNILQLKISLKSIAPLSTRRESLCAAVKTQHCKTKIESINLFLKSCMVITIASCQCFASPTGWRLLGERERAIIHPPLLYPRYLASAAPEAFVDWRDDRAAQSGKDEHSCWRGWDDDIPSLALHSPGSGSEDLRLSRSFATTCLVTLIFFFSSATKLCLSNFRHLCAKRIFAIFSYPYFLINLILLFLKTLFFLQAFPSTTIAWHGGINEIVIFVYCTWK